VRGERVVLADLDLCLEPGEALVLAGANGAGKTTLLRALASLLPPQAGTLRFGGRDALAEGEAYQAQLHYVGHRDAVKTQLSVAENLRFWMQLFGGEARTLGEALDQFGLGALADLPAAYLSAGQRRRLALTRLCALPRTLWLLDEPAASLDEDGRRRLAALIGAHRQAGGMVAMASHGELALEGARTLTLGRAA
jgi:heme exporter protein A